MKLLTMTLMFSLIVACDFSGQHATKIKLEGGETPTFVLSGDGLLTDFIVYGPRQRPGKSGKAFTVWQIQSIKGVSDGEPIKKIGRIKYGIVPEGYKQIYPENDSIPPPVMQGIRYAYWAQTLNASHAREEFEIIDGKATIIPGNR